MSIVSWIILGMVAGFLGSKLINRTGSGLFLDVLLGIVGAMVGGWVFQHLGGTGVTGLNLYSIVVAVLGSMIVLILYHAIRLAF